MNILVVSKSEEEFFFGDSVVSEHKIEFSSDVGQALAYIKSHSLPDMLIIDTLDAGNKAIDLLKNVRGLDEAEDLFIILITGRDEISLEVEGLKHGADEYMRRPLRKESFEAVLHLYEKFIFQRSEKDRFKELAMLYDAVFQQAPIGISISHNEKPLEGRPKEHFEVNQNYMKITGRTAEELLESGWSSITHPDDREKELELYRQMQQGITDSYAMEKRYIRPDGTVVWVDLIANTIDFNVEVENNHICIVQDITERKNAELALNESERSKGILISNMPGMAYRCKNDENWTMLSMSDKCRDILGYQPEDLVDNKKLSYNDVILPEWREKVREAWNSGVNKKKPVDLSYKVQTKDGQVKWVHEIGEAIYGEDGKIEYLEGMVFDDTKRRQTEEDLKFITEHQVWTGLYNRRYLDKYFSEKSALSYKSALILVNMSKLLSLNLSFGYRYYSDIIKKIGSALKAFADENRTLFHISENLFIFYVEKYEFKEDLEAFSRDISKALESLLSLELISGGIGIVEVQGNSDDLDKLISYALIASEETSEDAGERITYFFFDSEMENRHLRRELIKQELSRLATGSNEERLFLEYQPIINIKEGDRIWSFEALARFNSEVLGRLSPLEFIPIAEETKLIIPIGELIIEKAFDFQKTMEASGETNIGLNINLSVVQLREEGFCDKLFALADEKGIKLEKITFEITETALAENLSEINHAIVRLLEKGAEIAIDDFGTGYSSLARERELNVSGTKIDKYFMDKLMTLETFDESIIGDIISMSHKLDNYVVAEGVEHQVQMDFLRIKGCDGVQGYLISRPLSAKDAFSFIKDYQPIG